MKRVMVISSSLRAGSNSQLLANAFAAGAKEAGHDVRQVSLRGMEIKFCIGCLKCQQTQRCVFHDDADAIVQQMKDMDVLTFATPIYYYEMAGQLKTLLDRANPLFPSDYRFRDIYLIATAAEAEDQAVNGAQHGLQGWIECFEKSRLAHVLRGVGVRDVEEVKSRPELLEAAFNMGKSV